MHENKTFFVVNGRPAKTAGEIVSCKLPQAYSPSPSNINPLVKQNICLIILCLCRYNFDNQSLDASDCDGHGTHISSTAVGRTVGVAKDARIFAVRVLNCQGVGNVSNVVAGLNWVAQNAVKPAIATLSLVIFAPYLPLNPIFLIDH